MLLLLACSDNGLHRVSGLDTFTQMGNAAVDVLWVIDNSVSMEQEQELVAAGIGSFLDRLDEEDTEMDLHIGAVTTDMEAGNDDRGVLLGEPAWLDGTEPDFELRFRERVAVGTDGADKEQGLSAARFALTDAAANEGFLREEANLAIVFVSDENDCSISRDFPDDGDAELCYAGDPKLVPVRDFVLAFQGLKGDNAHAVVSAIVGPMGQQDCETSTPGQRYITTAEKLEGAVGDICDSDYTSIMDAIAGTLVAPQTVFPLSDPPYKDEVTVNVDDEPVEEDVETGFWYDSEYQSVRFDGSYVPPTGSEIDIMYTVGTG
jgi:hypothetical protein